MPVTPLAGRDALERTEDPPLPVIAKVTGTVIAIIAAGRKARVILRKVLEVLDCGPDEKPGRGGRPRVGLP